jgi:hypothetical protein
MGLLTEIEMQRQQRRKTFIWAFVLLCGAVATWGLININTRRNLTSGEVLALRGEMTAVRMIDFQRLRQSLPPRIRAAPQVMMVVEFKVDCRACRSFPYAPNMTGIPAVLISESAPPGDHPELNTAVLKPGSVDGLPHEVYQMYPMALLIDYGANTVTVAPGQIPNWADYLSTLHTYEPYSKEKI